MSKSNIVFSRNVRIENNDPSKESANFPKNIDICITKVPVRKRDGYSIENMRSIAKKLKNAMIMNGIVFIVCYAPVECKSRPFEISQIMTEEGFKHIDNIIIQKSWLPGKRTENILVNSHEYVLYFCNGSNWVIDREPLKDYFKTPDDQSCVGNIWPIITVDGETDACNTWPIETGSLEQSIPYDLAELLLRMTNCLPGSLIADPFMSNTSTLLASLKLGHGFWGCEQDIEKIKKYKEIIEKYKKENQMYDFVD